MEKFVPPTVDDLIKKHQVIEKARVDAQQGLPSKDREPLSVTERDLTDLFVKDTVIVQRERVQGRLEKLHHDRVDLGILKAVKNLQTAPEDLKVNLDKLESEQKTKLIQLRLELIGSEYSFNLFRSQNSLKNEPVYPESKVFHYSIIFLIILVETILNSFFLSEGSELGFIGGFVSALIITCLNVFFAWIFGALIIPRFFHMKIYMKVLAAVLTTLYLYASVNFSLLVGHYRSAIHSDPFEAAELSVKSYLAGAWDITNFYGWVLFGISLLVSVFAAFKFFIADDRYPGYGSIHRQKVEKEVRFDFARGEYIELYHQLVEEFKEKDFQLKSDIDSYVQSYKVSLNKSNNLVEDYTEFCSELNSSYSTYINAYRSENKRVCPTERPSYFDTDAILDDGKLSALDENVISHIRADEKVFVEEIAKKYKEIPDVLDKSLSEIQIIKSQSTDSNSRFITEVNELAVTKQVENQNHS